jgi:hypothetical protein
MKAKKLCGLCLDYLHLLSQISLLAYNLIISLMQSRGHLTRHLIIHIWAPETL